MLGHNQPPPFEAITLRAEELLAGAARAATEFPVITDQETADRLSGFLKQLRAVARDATAEEKAEKAPHQQAVKDVAEKWAPLKLRLEKADEMLEPRLEKWLRDERARIAAEQEAKRRAAEAAEKTAQELAAAAQAMIDKAASGLLKGVGGDPVEMAAQAAEQRKQADAAAAEARAAEKAKPQAGSQFGGASGRARSSHLTVTYKARILSWENAARYYSNHPKVREAIQAAADADARKLKETGNVPSVLEVYTEEGLRI